MSADHNDDKAVSWLGIAFICIVSVAAVLYWIS